MCVCPYARHGFPCVLQGSELGRRSGLGAIEWLRVVLDEAHTIRNSDTQQAKVSQHTSNCMCKQNSRMLLVLSS
jgi:SNF2 family DNA or RNA helicase